jgi:hypothetical protein
MASPPPAQPNADCTSFLHLPLEIRYAIYGLVLDRSTPVTVFDGCKYRRKQCPRAGNFPYMDLLHVDRQISEEAKSVFYRKNTFVFYGDGDHFSVSNAWAALHIFLLTIGERNRSYLRHVLVTTPIARYSYVSSEGVPVHTSVGMWPSSIVEWKPILLPVYGITMKMMSKIPALVLDFYITDGWNLEYHGRWEGTMAVLKENPERPKVRFVMDLAMLRDIFKASRSPSIPPKLLPPNRGWEMVVVDSTDNSQLGFTVALRDGHYTITDGPKAGQRLTQELVERLSSKDFETAAN